MDNLLELLKTYTAAVPTSVIAVVLIVLGLKLGKFIFKVVGLVLAVAAIRFYILKF